MTVPRRFVGAWEREHLSIGGQDAAGIGRALWIETGGTYVDIRAPGSVASGTSFGGRSAWESPVFVWHHDVDTHPRPGSVDRGDLSVLDDCIVERGIGIDGGTAPYEERWRRLPTTNLDTAIAMHKHGVAARVGNHAAFVLALPAGTTCARAWQYDNGRWIALISLGSPGEHPEPHAAGWRLSAGWHLTSASTASD
jgi:hypothetical protein